MKKFDIILSNPPFQDVSSRKKTPHKLWIDFTKRELSEWLAEGGYLLQVSPSSFSSPSSKILPLFRSLNVPYINLDIGKFFPAVGSSFSAYVVRNQPAVPGEETKFVVAGGEQFDVILDDSVAYLPNDLNRLSFGIHKKVMFAPGEKLKVEHDYVTHHNIRLKDADSTLSKTETSTHHHPVFHTNKQTWWSSVKQKIADRKKVVWTRSGYTKPFYDDGVHGTSDMGYYIFVESDTEGENLSHNLNSKLFHYIFTTARWSGFGNEIVFSKLPHIPSNVKLTDAEMFHLFGLTDEEKEYVETYKPSKKVSLEGYASLSFRKQPGLDWDAVTAEADKHSYMGKILRAAERVKNSAEIFTPTELVVSLLSQIDIAHFGPGKIVLDPACGDAQFLAVAKTIKTLFHGMSEKEALDELYGVDIMSDNVALAKSRLGGGNIFLGDPLNPTKAVEGQTEADFNRLQELFL